MINYKTELISVRNGMENNVFWAQARAGAIPGADGKPPMIVLTAQPTLRSGSDIFFALSEWRSTDYGKTWDGPVEHAETLGRRKAKNGTIEIGCCDMTPKWHAASGKLLSTGHSVVYQNDKSPMTARERVAAYSAYDPDKRTWTPWQGVKMPDDPKFRNAGSGAAQRFDLEDGTILLPFSFKPITENWHEPHTAAVMRCSFDGERLEYMEHGSELTIPEPRGFCEPSITRYNGRFYLTLRNDTRGHVTVGDDGLHFERPVPWRFDDGTELGNYNTQQHWVQHAGGLFLVYTRRGLNNDHVFRHRAPLMMAEVDPEKLVVLRDTERELVPNRGARLGNFAICEVSDDETWVVVAEWMQPVGCEKYGSDNTIWAARIIRQEQ